MDQIRKHKLIYLATPYSRYAYGPEIAFRHACEIVAKLIIAGVRVYSPIVNTHSVAIHGDMDPLDHSMWLDYDKMMMELSSALVIAKMEGWDKSFGIAEESKVFKSSGKPIYYLTPATLEIVLA